MEGRRAAVKISGYQDLTYRIMIDRDPDDTWPDLESGRQTYRVTSVCVIVAFEPGAEVCCRYCHTPVELASGGAAGPVWKTGSQDGYVAARCSFSPDDRHDPGETGSFRVKGPVKIRAGRLVRLDGTLGRVMGPDWSYYGVTAELDAQNAVFREAALTRAREMHARFLATGAADAVHYHAATGEENTPCLCSRPGTYARTEPNPLVP
jgi:hypothetical protein